LLNRPSLGRALQKICVPSCHASGASLDSTTARIKVKKVLEADDSIVGNEVLIQGWIRTVRDQKKFSFIEVNDGSCLTGIQAVAPAEMASYEEVKKLTTGSAASIQGTIVRSQGKGQKYEILANSITLVGSCPSETYPLQKKRHSQEFLRSLAHLRARTNTISAVARVRSALAYATHQYFQQEGFVYVQTPLITSSDCEGAGEMFRVTTLPLDNIAAIPTIKQPKQQQQAKAQGAASTTPSAEPAVAAAAEVVSAQNQNSSKKLPVSADFSKDFFGKPTYLTVSGQLSGETYACALGDIYTFGPTFRAEQSQTSRHLAEFHMIEPEMAFADMDAAMRSAESYVKYVIAYALQQCPTDMQFFEKYMDPQL
jgi:asparaginyl-tRNA synthetase